MRVRLWTAPLAGGLYGRWHLRRVLKCQLSPAHLTAMTHSHWPSSDHNPASRGLVAAPCWGVLCRHFRFCTRLETAEDVETPERFVGSPAERDPHVRRTYLGAWGLARVGPGSGTLASATIGSCLDAAFRIVRSFDHPKLNLYHQSFAPSPAVGSCNQVVCASHRGIPAPFWLFCRLVRRLPRSLFLQSHEPAESLGFVSIRHAPILV